MKLLFWLSGENIDLGKEEIIALTNKKCKNDGRVVLVDTKPFLFERLAYTKKVCKFLFSCKKENLVEKIKKFNFEKYYNGSFCVRKNGKLGLGERELAAYVWKKLKKPRVELENPKTQFEFFSGEKKIYCGILIKNVGKGFSFRRPHLRPGFHPASLNPKIARVMVNLTGIKKGQTLLDPFCGVGGILIEAALIGCNVVGVDIDRKMLYKARRNLEFFSIKKYKLIEGDATKIKIKSKFIATDPPYGRSSSLHKRKREELYNEFIKNVEKNILKKGGKICIILPSGIELRTRLKKIAEIKQYVHKSLIRKIFVYKKLD